MRMKNWVELVSFFVLLFWFITVESWNPLKYALAVLLLLLVIDFVSDNKFFWEEPKRTSTKRRRKK